jgi:hypothetical protein
MQINGWLRASVLFFLRKELRYSLNREMAGTQSWYEPDRKDKSPFPYWDIKSGILSNSLSSLFTEPTYPPQRHSSETQKTLQISFKLIWNCFATLLISDQYLCYFN